MTYQTRLKLRRVVSVAFAITWCGVYPASYLAIWFFNLSVGDALAVLAASSALGLVAGLLNDHL
jgi:hypothetical protein